MKLYLCQPFEISLSKKYLGRKFEINNLGHLRYFPKIDDFLTLIRDLSL